ncbi:MAG: cation-transporting P-type ATPase [Candidatus Nanoarchaeia archaeon]|nr:cation-transporting P-type ATPase [Candidatus Nanoarchaeia archaeon]MDD5357700.1 cation-transporting P-type ATPase [Candidatus Nanoarchaeia archaeon]MDD5588619.1 cation-transporting P-type ATPase [Candidatus Nanoarchaeia archaeon]
MWHSLDKKEVLEKLKTSENGLSDEEALKRLKEYGKNELKQIHKINPFFIFLSQFKSVFILILFAAAIFSFFIEHYIDFGVIMAIIVLNSTIGFFQQYKAEKIIAKMKEFIVPKVKVLRNGKLSEVLSSEIVPGDIIVISEGDKITADCRILYVNELQANEAVLTGESFPQDKSSEKLLLKVQLADRENMLYAGTTIVRGNAKAVVVSTGMRTEFGNIAEKVQTIKQKKTPLEIKLDAFSKRIAAIVLIITILIVIAGIYNGEEIFQMILAGIVLAVSVIPEGLPAVISITLAFAIKRMQKYNALIRKLPAGETLGRTTVICTDKTGTLTEEEMFVTTTYCNNNFFKIEDHSFYLDGRKTSPEKNKELLELLRAGIMCNNARLEMKGRKIEIFGDPTEKALVMSAYNSGFVKKTELEKEKRVKEYSFSSSRKMMSIIRKRNGEFVSYVKGAPDIILKKCSKELVNGKFVNLTSDRKKELLNVYSKMASDALRVLGFAYKEITARFNQETAESDLIFLGFQGMLDIPRKEVKDAIRDCRNAGIKVKMLTGDSEITAKAISKMINLQGESIEGVELEKLSDKDFGEAVQKITIFARITPEIKLRIIRTLREQREIVAVTGDGVNDILALKEAHIGIAMGIRGTDMARDVSDIILLDDNFSTIVHAIREGRRVYDNMKKSIKLHLSANIDELFVVIAAILFAMPLPFLPLAILWMNLITDSLPSLALAVEKEEDNIMKRGPINHSNNILNGVLKFVLIAGFISFLATIILFIIYQADLEKARTMALTVSVFCELFIALACRSDTKNIWKVGLFSNKFMLFSIIAAGALQIIAVYTPLAGFFGLKAISAGELLIAVAASSLGFIFFEIMKFFKIKI